jgi:hypothetical protein
VHVQDAFRSGSREKLLYVPAIVPDRSRPDYLATVDADPESPHYSQVVHRMPLGVGDEVHHSGWNACSSCHGDPSRSRSLLILPTLGTHRVYAVDVAADPRAPRIFKVVEPDEIQEKTGLAYLHTGERPHPPHPRGFRVALTLTLNPKLHPRRTRAHLAGLRLAPLPELVPPPLPASPQPTAWAAATSW